MRRQNFRCSTSPCRSHKLRDETVRSPRFPQPARARRPVSRSLPPVRVKARHDGWTPERQRAFIDRLCLTGNVARSAKAVGKTPQSAYKLREHGDAGSFRRAWDRALDQGRSHMIDIGLERCLSGEVVPVFFKGRKVGEWTRHDNSLVIAALNLLCRRERRPGLKNNGFLELWTEISSTLE